jgi:hypothetical protein
MISQRSVWAQCLPSSEAIRTRLVPAPCHSQSRQFHRPDPKAGELMSRSSPPVCPLLAISTVGEWSAAAVTRALEQVRDPGIGCRWPPHLT